jgi:hypothetical protein
MEYSFDTEWRLLARAARSLSEVYVLILGRAVVRGRVIVEDEADDETDETTTDMGGSLNELTRMTGARRVCRFDPTAWNWWEDKPTWNS